MILLCQKDSRKSSRFEGHMLVYRDFSGINIPHDNALWTANEIGVATTVPIHLDVCKMNSSGFFLDL